MTGKVKRNLFTEAQLEDIARGKQKIGNYTWHHHQEIGRMQLIPEDIHDWIKHVGGNSIWGI